MGPQDVTMVTTETDGHGTQDAIQYCNYLPVLVCSNASGMVDTL